VSGGRDPDRVAGAVFAALADPTRRTVLRRVAEEGPVTATELAGHLPVSRQAVAKHLAVLDRVGLVHGAAVGREHRYWVDEAQLARAADQLAAVGSAWDGRLARIARIAERIERQQQSPKQPRRSNP
jgi:DNA-binding transcriptional ArsR family regulator